MDLHRSYAREFDISEEEELEAELMAPTTQGYTDSSSGPQRRATSRSSSRHCFPACGASARPDSGSPRVAAAFLTSSRYELAFWQMAWEGERWLA